jgi:formylglycine-generating enzyme required for sulfatase activity
MRQTKLLTKALTIFAAVTIVASTCLAADYTEPTTGMEFVKITGGRFIMGDLYGTDEFAKPTHVVTAPNYYIGKYEVTFDQYDQFCEATKREKPSDEGWGRGDLPVINVSWKDAVAFTEWLSKETGKTFRLPTEAEWEYAARGGKESPYWWGNDIGVGLTNCRDCGGEWLQQTTPVGTYSANPYGLYDTSGNVYEWCLDHKNRNYVGAPEDGTAWLSGDDTQRIDRGGSWKELALDLRNSTRCWDRVDFKSNALGFRVVMEQ